MPALAYPVKLHKLELSDEEIKDLSDSKVRAICISIGLEIDAKLEQAINDIKTLLAVKTNKGDKNLDQKRSTSISHHQELCVIPDKLTSPQKAAAQNDTYVTDQSKAYHREQEKLFSLLIEHGGLDYRQLRMQDGFLIRNGTALKHEELCNTVDEATKFFLQNFDIPDGSISSGTSVRKEISEIYDSCLPVVAKRKAVSETFADNILDEQVYRKWAKHVEMIASFGALAAALKKLLL